MPTKHMKEKRALKKAKVGAFCHEAHRQTGGLAGYTKPSEEKDKKKTK